MHAAWATRAPLTSTAHTRQTATGCSRGSWQSTGMAIPDWRAASQIVVPSGTVTVCPSMVRVRNLFSWARISAMVVSYLVGAQHAAPLHIQFSPLLFRNESALVPPPNFIVPLDHLAQLGGGQPRPLSHARGQRFTQEAWREPVVARLPALTLVEQLLHVVNALPGATQLSVGRLPPRA